MFWRYLDGGGGLVSGFDLCIAFIFPRVLTMVGFSVGVWVLLVVPRYRRRL